MTGRLSSPIPSLGPRCERTRVTDRGNLPNRDGATFDFKDVPSEVCEVYVKASLDEVVAAAASEKAEPETEDGAQFNMRRSRESEKAGPFPLQGGRWWFRK